jgi:cell division protein FtsI/penicillin-binding protein 2
MLVGQVDAASADALKDARVPGYAVAGISASVPGASDSSSSTAATADDFVGFAPADRARFAVYVRLEGSTSRTRRAPAVFGVIARELMRYYQIPPSRPVAGSGT